MRCVTRFAVAAPWMPDRRRVAPTYDTSVFVNCPFDAAYTPTFHAIVFALLDCGFTPRCALEVDDAGLVRFEKILLLVKGCRFGIHDISRTELDRRNRLPRFNMPLELGLFLGAQRFGTGAQRRKTCLVLDRAPYRYQKFVSDIAGQDIKSHDDRPERAIAAIRTWLSSAANASLPLPGGTAIAQRYHGFRGELPELCRRLRLRLSEMTFTDYCSIAAEWLDAATIQPSPSGARGVVRG
jgi:hypothetical protein